MGLNGDMAAAFALFFIKSKIGRRFLIRNIRGSRKKVVILHKIGSTSIWKVNFLYVRLALFSHETGRAWTK